MSGRVLGVVVALACAGLPLAACTEVESTTAAGYEPATLDEVDGGATLVRFTEEGAARTDLRTEPALRQGRHTVVPYAALLYDGDGAPLVYTVAGPRSFVRADVVVARVSGDHVVLRDGVRPGTEVVTVGAAEVYGAEHEIGGGH